MKRLLQLGLLTASVIAVVAQATSPGAAHVLNPALLSRAVSLGSLTFTGVYPRIITPNGDGANDKVGFYFDNPDMLPVDGQIFDLSGAKVASLQPGRDPNSSLLWNGKDSSGRTVPGGIYLYQVESQGKQATGTVVVAR